MLDSIVLQEPSVHDMSLIARYPIVPHMWIFGEIHTNQDQREFIHDAIRKLKPEVILHELLYSDVATTRREIERRLSTCRPGGTCDPRLNKDIYQLGLELDCELVGIDLDEKADFPTREAHMLDKLTKTLDKRQRIVAVVGDTHLREKHHPTLGEPSVIATHFKYDRRVEIVRAPKRIREVQ